ncbi:phytanoyl-CoA dioxygenase family protein [Streptomyces sp. TRM76323]|uniref:Phytanoyl-CoA dioxygenase family protein n=1 Tax=Streptomyces tamarix TaxID=3078565 RepID=A0ABU3QTX9_9ACTN|nr:phytanoyl-CoA dioxygenase family protein [Streptomyces tamarix]MDT9686208.1 phytanoyl-CoA dioxygenase family protein [Streptomyces tamarix]
MFPASHDSLDEQLARGFVLLPRLLGPTETRALGEAAESVLARVTGKAPDGAAEVTVWPDGHRLEKVDGTTVHWEPEARPPAVRSLSPVTHLDPVLDALWTDDRITAPVRRIVGSARLGRFTSKVNFKRAGVGSEFHWHQDYPYWYCCAGADARDVATAMVFLDDVTADNGALEIVPGSHLAGPAPRDRSEPTGLLVDTARTDVRGAVTVEAPAGSVLVFPGLAVHRSGPNRTASDRRSLLLCFQPAGRPELAALPYRAERLADLP